MNTLDENVDSATAGKPLIATKLASITGSIIINQEMGYTYAPTVGELKKALYKVWEDGREILKKKGRFARERGLKLFAATKMAAAYERLFLCISGDDKETNNYCIYQP